MASDDFGDAIKEWYKQLESAVTLTAAERGEITAAGAAAYVKVLKRMTPRSHVDYSKGGKRAGHATRKKRAHLADQYRYKDGYTADGLNTGDTDVGQSDHYFDFLARLLNDGQKKMSTKELANLHFTDRAQEAAKGDVFAAMLAKYQQLTGGGES
ncbi:phage tail protein [Lacticaseibacillus parakribbianus]|uniref:phage tail protein n=1 Tax=Lacticaseibacillus parakribbianus TaxID=2970927 RepID=UPI0021CB0274|nr:phage tail protein [Lacticaseibacillus parakribbianus]